MNKRIGMIFLFCALCLMAAPVCAARTAGAWLPYWESEASLGESSVLGEELHTVIAFEAFFREDGSVYVPQETEDMLEQLTAQYAGSKTRVFLSVVNDVIIDDESVQNKSKPILECFFRDEMSIERHVEALLTLVDRYHLAGLEIDYENIKKDTALWEKYFAFVKRLNQLLSRDGVALRCALEWDAAKWAELPDGVEYSIMCYNLFGYHSGPGPKADRAFLSQVFDLYAGREDSVSMAFATGGFVWEGESVLRALTQTEAEEFAEENNLTCERDPDSGVLKADFERDGQTYSLWYADAETLNFWAELAGQKGFDKVDLFRLGGNNLDDLNERFFAGQTAGVSESGTE